MKKPRNARARALAALKRETAGEVRAQVRMLLNRPMAERTDFLLVPFVWPDGRVGWMP